MQHSCLQAVIGKLTKMIKHMKVIFIMFTSLVTEVIYK